MKQRKQIEAENGAGLLSLLAEVGRYGFLYGFLCLCQDPHLNRFFQQCQKRELDLSLPPTSNFLNCLKVNTKALFIKCDSNIDKHSNHLTPMHVQLL